MNAAKRRPKPKERRKKDSEQTRLNILEVAIDEFSSHGLSGARVDVIAHKTLTSKRMIYYYYKNKVGLYRAVLEHIYIQMRNVERSLKLDGLSPQKSLANMIEAIFDFHHKHPHVARIVNMENVNYANHLSKLRQIRAINQPAVDVTSAILEKGYQEGQFVRKIDPLDLHLIISALCISRVRNQHTVEAAFGQSSVSHAVDTRNRKLITDMVVGYLCMPPRDDV